MIESITFFLRTVFVAFITFMLIFGALNAYNHWREKIEREGYERGFAQGALHYKCVGDFGTQAFRDETWQIVNADQLPCEYYRAKEAEIAKR